jgi:hypothetical protein
MNVERIKDAQDEIRKYLPDRPEYVVDTSEFESVKTRLEMLENSRHLGGVKPTPGRPVLLKRASTSTPSGSDDSSQTPADNGKPTLKRAPGSTSTDSTNSTTTTAGANSTTTTGTASTSTSNSGSTDATQASGTPSSPSDDDRPVLKRNPSSTSD